MMPIARFWQAAALLLSLLARAQAPLPVRDSADLQMELERLQVLGSVLYIAAHPDDENTAALATFAKGRKLRTGYLALTRGGGGQDLIGPELDDSLALLRTQELLAARRIDGAEQFFTRTVDFGYSKTPEETLATWGHEAALAEVVWTVRTFRPDVIVTRFSPTGKGTHGHHTASAILALEAFQAAGDPTRFPEQLAWVKPWQATRIFWNSWRSPAERAALPPSSQLSLDVGAFDPLLGRSYQELAAESRSQHRSQGFGALSQRGSRLEYFERLAGQAAGKDLFEGIDTSWRRVPGGEAVGALLAEARQAFQPAHPTAILPKLLAVKARLEQLPADPWVTFKRQELVEVIRAAAGLWVEALADRQTGVPGSSLAVATAVIVRGEAPLTLVKVTPSSGGESHLKSQVLPFNQPVKEALTLTLPTATPLSQPHWLRGPREGGLHTPAPAGLAGLPENPPALSVTFTFAAHQASFDVTVPVQYRFRDPVLGERYQPLAVIPPVMVNLAERVQPFADLSPRELGLNLVAGRPNVKGRLRFRLPKGWQAEPAEIPFALEKASDEAKVHTRITPSSTAQTGELRVDVDTDGVWGPAHQRVQINYPHIPLQTMLPPAQARLVRVDLKRLGRRIGYVMGAGDEVPQSLRPLGYEVELLSDEALGSQDLSGYDAIVLGIRAFNTRPRLVQLQSRILEYVARGGTEVVQYNVHDAFPGTNADLATEAIGPFPFRIGRERVTEENAPVTLLEPGHPIFNRPNKLGPADFADWVQERGLYYPASWDPRYQAILAMHDAGEQPLTGALLVTKHGKGHFVYTGLAFFRQLPEGVPGAHRLFANLLALSTPHE